MPLYAQTSGSLNTVATNLVAIPGLALTLPGGEGIFALVTLNLPSPWATGNNFPGGSFAISVDGVISPVGASFTYNEQTPQGFGRVPTTLVVGVPLIQQEQTVVALWQGVRGSTVNLDSPATLSAVLDD